jgi:orotate phosphoribosyltransferase-like protein
MKQTVSNLMGDDLTVKAVETTTNSDNGFSNTIPVLPINFAEYDSANIDVWDEYITIGNEKDRAIKAILSQSVKKITLH